MSVNGERVGAARPQRAHERDRSEEQPRDQDAADPHHGRSAARLGRVHPALRRPGRRPARAAREHARRRQHQLRRHGAAAPARLDDPRAVGRHRRVGHAEPPDDLHLPPDQREGRGDVRRGDRQGADRPQAYRGAADARRRAGRDDVLRAGAQDGRLRERHPHGAAVDAREPALPVPPRAGARRAGAEGVGDLPHQRPGPRVAAVVLPLGHGAGRRAASRPRGAGALRTPLGLEKQVRRMLADRALGGAVDALRRRSGCGCRTSRRFIPTTCCSRSTTTRWRRRCSARPSSSSTASSARIAPCSTC